MARQLCWVWSPEVHPAQALCPSAGKAGAVGTLEHGPRRLGVQAKPEWWLQARMSGPHRAPLQGTLGHSDEDVWGRRSVWMSLFLRWPRASTTPSEAARLQPRACTSLPCGPFPSGATGPCGPPYLPRLLSSLPAFLSSYAQVLTPCCPCGTHGLPRTQSKVPHGLIHRNHGTSQGQPESRVGMGVAPSSLGSAAPRLPEPPSPAPLAPYTQGLSPGPHCLLWSTGQRGAAGPCTAC